MPFIGSIISGRLANLDPKSERLRRERAEKKRVGKERTFARSLDEAELSSVEEVEAIESTRAVERAESEEGREDREKLGYYEPGGGLGPGPGTPQIDLEG